MIATEKLLLISCLFQDLKFGSLKKHKNMIATEKLLLISCLFQGIICNTFEAFMPQRIKALSGSCVLIPCTFTIPKSYENDMVEPARGIWMTSYNFRDIVFDSSRHYSENTLKAELLGNVTNKNCTTIIHHLKTSDSKRYFFRAEPPNFTFYRSVLLEVADSPDRPVINPSSAVKEGAPTSLACTAPAPCPRDPPALVWSDTLNGSVEIEQVEQQDGTKAVSSVLTFTASHLHHNKDITCTAQYPVESETKSAEEVSTLHVLYSPKNTLVLINPSGEIHEGDHVTLSCSSNANPAVSRYTWFEVKGDNINEKSAEQYLTFTDINPSDSGLYYCEARNEHGAENSTAVQLNVAYSPKNTSVLINPSGEIHEGDHVTLSCSSNANPAVSCYTWFEVKGDNITEKSAEQYLTFTDINPSDSGLYYCEARNKHGAENSRAVQLNVACMPQISHESSCSKDDTESITCICVSRGSPSPITEWRIAGNKLENNTDRGSISNSKLEDHTMRSTLILLKPLAKNEAIQCLSKNRIGTASFQFHVFHEQKEGAEKQIHFLSAVYGGFACAAVLLLGFGFSKCVKKLMKSRSTARPKREDTAALTEVNGLDLSSPQDEEENAIYANRPAATEDHQQGGQEENLHYASIDYSKLKPGNQESGTKHASQYSTEYSEVKRPGTAGSEREVTDPPIEENEYAEMKGCPAKNRENTAAKSVSTEESDYAEVRRCHTSPE
ncbi:myelin-associated glycoprotein-like isoform X1 [Acipenser ruthenus]|uniref:myelin-associated glycoprotein-like isoform X1 n=1 Tax=Acipenser ruthenus TaxID=7906 RepID=UPI002742652A|nr:myelin-associated glycoprotein-like isoform X1 [Acipenser ruthenus]